MVDSTVVHRRPIEDRPARLAFACLCIEWILGRLDHPRAGGFEFIHTTVESTISPAPKRGKLLERGAGRTHFDNTSRL